jgi:hypothetical protein
MYSNNEKNNEKNNDKISYSELKELHNLSMLTLTNMSKVLPTTPTPTPTTPQTIYSSKDVKISKTNNNYLIPYHPFKDPCFICKYFGHGIRNCPNIKKEFRGGNYCLNCWEAGHLVAECNGEIKVPPYNENFLSPEEIINHLFYKVIF